MVPAIKVAEMQSDDLMTAVSAVDGTAGITMGEGDAPETADSRFSIWEDDEE